MIRILYFTVAMAMLLSLTGIAGSLLNTQNETPMAAMHGHFVIAQACPSGACSGL